MADNMADMAGDNVDDNEHVYQADPATCVRVARESLDEALALLHQADPDMSEVLHLVSEARNWLPSWLMDHWDGRMAEWIDRTNRRPVEVPRSPVVFEKRLGRNSAGS